jgi:hypothetical protein
MILVIAIGAENKRGNYEKVASEIIGDIHYCSAVFE